MFVKCHVLKTCGKLGFFFKVVFGVPNNWGMMKQNNFNLLGNCPRNIMTGQPTPPNVPAPRKKGLLRAYLACSMGFP